MWHLLVCVPTRTYPVLKGSGAESNRHRHSPTRIPVVLILQGKDESGATEK